MKITKLFLYFVFLPTNVFGQNHIELALSTAYRVDDFKWSISGNSLGMNPNVLSELSWNQLEGPAIKLNLKLPLIGNIALAASYGEHYVTKGSVTDTDYQQDNRMNPSFNVVLNSNRGKNTSFDIGLIYTKRLEKLTISPTISYNLQQQHLYLQDGLSLNSSYSTKWYGIKTGFIAEYLVSDMLAAQADFFYDQLRYRAVANWNLIENFARPESFKHYASGFGISGSVKFIYKLNTRFHPFATLGAQLSRTGKGIDELYYASGSKSYTQLNGVGRKSQEFGIGIYYRFD